MGGPRFGFVGVVGIGSLVTTSSVTSSTRLPMIVPTWLQFLRTLAFEDRPPDPDPPDPTNISRRLADVWVPRGPSGGRA